mmetsp:Transcript_30150/g.55378  ORF Transcript_30150/g.55378 Transcript_30150/m.55378 type:complete len:547 (-) Transcript_30150:47-1687(-)
MLPLLLLVFSLVDPGMHEELCSHDLAEQAVADPISSQNDSLRMLPETAFVAVLDKFADLQKSFAEVLAKKEKESSDLQMSFAEVTKNISDALAKREEESLELKKSFVEILAKKESFFEKILDNVLMTFCSVGFVAVFGLVYRNSLPMQEWLPVWVLKKFGVGLEAEAPEAPKHKTQEEMLARFKDRLLESDAIYKKVDPVFAKLAVKGQFVPRIINGEAKGGDGVTVRDDDSLVVVYPARGERIVQPISYFKKFYECAGWDPRDPSSYADLPPDQESEKQFKEEGFCKFAPNRMIWAIKLTQKDKDWFDGSTGKFLIPNAYGEEVASDSIYKSSDSPEDMPHLAIGFPETNAWHVYMLPPGILGTDSYKAVRIYAQEHLQQQLDNSFSACPPKYKKLSMSAKEWEAIPNKEYPFYGSDGVCEVMQKAPKEGFHFVRLKTKWQLVEKHPDCNEVGRERGDIILERTQKVQLLDITQAHLKMVTGKDDERELWFKPSLKTPSIRGPSRVTKLKLNDCLAREFLPDGSTAFFIVPRRFCGDFFDTEPTG